jgi:tetratricopeptide (TPR) repeat protein
VSGSYLSLIESGHRTATPGLLERLAAELGCSSEYLESGRGGPADSDVELDLRFAEVALRAGDAPTALERFERVAALAQERSLRDVELEACWGRARAQETIGSMESAIEGYERLAQEPNLPGSLQRAVILTALCRAHLMCGDLASAVTVGESALSELAGPEAQEPLDEAIIALASTLVGCYYERGDLGRGQRLATEALARADANGSPTARAAALWNAGLISEASGDLRTARLHIERALALYSETDNARATALLRVAAAWMMLRDDEPSLPEAEAHLSRALTELPVVGTVLDTAYAETELARCRLLRGDWQEALTMAEAVVTRLAEAGPRLEGARACLLAGDAQTVGGDSDAAIANYERAAEALRSSGATRQAASAWRELAESLARVGRWEAAVTAYRAMGDATGVVAPPYDLDRIKRSTPEAPAGAPAGRPRRPQRPVRR